MELKNLHRDIKAAFEENLADYKDTVPHLFHHNAFIILGKFADDEITQEVFGEYVSTYDFQRAVEDKSTVPLYYDARGEKLVFKDEDGAQHSVADPKGLNEKIAAKLVELEIDDIDVQQRLERELKRDYHLITSSSRLGQIAEDFVQHYSQGWETGKAMLVCIDKITCVLKLVNALSAEEKRAQREHLNEETLALFDLLQKPDLKSKERERIKQVAAELLETLKAERLNIANWRDKEATRDAVRQQIYDFLYDENTGLPVNDYTPDEIPVLRDRVFQHVYRSYPTLPSPYFQA